MYQALCQELWPAIVGGLGFILCCFVCDRIYVRKAVFVPQQKMFPPLHPNVFESAFSILPLPSNFIPDSLLGMTFHSGSSHPSPFPKIVQREKSYG